MTTINDFPEAVAAVAAAAGPSVVSVTGRRTASGGSGVVVASGRVLTNAHNLRGELEVTFADGRTERATAVAADPDGDIAVLEVDTGDAPAVQWGSSGVSLGAAVFGVANPEGRGLRVTFGLVSATEASFRGPRGRRIAGSIEHTVPLLPGSSGGPIVDAEGRVIGINTHRLGDGFYLAIPADDALRKRIDKLSRGESPSRKRLGVAVASAEVSRRLRQAVGLEPVDGALVRAVGEDTPASRAGIRQGDVIVDIGGHAVQDADELMSALDDAGDKVTVKIVRGTEELSVEVSF